MQPHLLHTRNISKQVHQHTSSRAHLQTHSTHGDIVYMLFCVVTSASLNPFATPCVPSDFISPPPPYTSPASPPIPCSLLSTRVSAHVHAYNAHVCLHQTYRNNSNKEGECLYRFPLDANAAVSGRYHTINITPHIAHVSFLHCRFCLCSCMQVSAFRATFDDGTVITGNTNAPTHHVLKRACSLSLYIYIYPSISIYLSISPGIVHEKSTAQDIYQSAVSSNMPAALLQREEATHHFTTHIGNIRAYQCVTITIEYVTQLEMDAGVDVRFVLSRCIAASYAMSVPMSMPLLMPANDAATTTTDACVVNNTSPYDVTCTLHMSLPIVSIMSPTHTLAIVRGDDVRHAVATINVPSDGLTSDIVLLISQQATTPFIAHAQIETHPTHHTRVMQLTFVHPTQSNTNTINNNSHTSHEYLFIIDRSGSMSGSSIAAVRDTLTIALRSLEMSCLFNVVSFGSRYSKLWEVSREYSDVTMAEVTQTQHA